MNATGQVTETAQSHTPSAAAGRRRITRVVVALAAAGTMALLTVSPAQAVNDNASNLTVAGQGVTAGASVTCDPTNKTLTISARTTTMEASGFAGPIAGPYDSGQWIRYNVWTRDADGNGDWAPLYSWSPWQWVTSLTSTAMVERLSVPVELGTNVGNGQPGHNYQALVQIDWWTGVDNVADITPVYYQAYTADPFNTYYFNPSRCVF